jgi:hypothetical protein
MNGVNRAANATTRHHCTRKREVKERELVRNIASSSVSMSNATLRDDHSPEPLSTGPALAAMRGSRRRNARRRHDYDGGEAA